MSQQDKRSRRRRPSDERNDVRRKKRHSNRKNTSDRHRRRRKVKKRENKLSRTIGLVLAIVQLIATGIFMAGIFKLNMLPTKYVVAATVALVLFWGVILASQFFSKKNAITGKIISVLITVLLIFSSYYLFKVSGTVSKISGGEYKLDKVVVSVMADDSAEAIKDAKNYTFGVQYKMNGDQIKQTVQAINEELGTEIKTEEYDTLAEQAEALHDGKVDAIIYNQGFTGVLEEAFEGYEDNTKVIYSHDIKTEIEDTSSDVEVKNDTFSVYISGIDVYGAIETNSRSDVNIIAEVNPTTHQILLVTTPRDYYVEIPEVSGGQKDKLTHAGIYGVDKSMKTLEKLYDTNLDFYARVNFTSLITMVDALGGVDVESEYAFTTSKDSADFTVTNHPIAGLTVKGDKLIVSIGTNFAFISGKTGLLDHTSSGCYGYQFEETDYNPTYTNYKKYQQFMGSQSNDNDEFMWSANFVDTVDMKTLTGTSHNYETVSVPATCGRDAFTEERCSDCGLIKDGTRVEKENTAHEHHYIKFHEVYYTKTDGVKNEADNYVCPECGACITEPVKSKYEQANSTYEKRKAIWDAAIKNEAEGHTYVPTDAKWSDDYSTVTFQNLTCESCADKIDKLDCLLSSDDNATNKANRDSINKTLDKAVTVDAKMVSHAGTCDEGVTAVYKAADKTEDGVKYLVSTEVKGEAGQHTYSDVKFNWDAAAIKDDDGNITGYKTDQKEGTSVTVDEVKCSVCGEVQKNVSVSVVKDTDAYKAPTCEEAGKDVYVATVTSTDDNTVLAKETKEVAIAKLGHKYGDPVWSDWEEKDGKWTTTATFTCANDATHVQTPEVKIDSETVEKATYTKEGKVVYTASVTSPDGKKVVNPTTKEVVVEKERLAAVENLKASSSVGKVKLTWSEVKDAEGYLIYGIRGGGNKYGYIGMTSKTSFVDVKALTSDYNYYWVFAYCKDENGKMYPGLTAHYVYGKAQKCAAVTDLKASSVKGGVKLTWTKSAGAEGYLVYGIHPGEKYGYIGMTTKGTTFTDKKASSTDWNFYWVFPYHTDSNGNKVVGGTPKYVYGKAK